jgi:hypothetical protein
MQGSPAGRFAQPAKVCAVLNPAQLRQNSSSRRGYMDIVSKLCVHIVLHKHTFYVQRCDEIFQPFGAITQLPEAASNEVLGELITSHLDPAWRIRSKDESLLDMLARSGDHLSQDSLLIDVERGNGGVSLDAMSCYPANELGLTAHLVCGSSSASIAEGVRLVCRGAQAFVAGHL